MSIPSNQIAGLLQALMGNAGLQQTGAADQNASANLFLQQGETDQLDVGNLFNLLANQQTQGQAGQMPDLAQLLEAFQKQEQQETIAKLDATTRTFIQEASKGSGYDKEYQQQLEDDIKKIQEEAAAERNA